MRNAIAVMNTKGGVGKSTLVLGLAETLSVYENKTVLVIDSDSQASVSSMLMSTPQLYELQSNGRTLVDYLVNDVLHGQTDDARAYLVANVSDVDDAETVALLPSDVQLTLFEREVSHERRHDELRQSINRLLDQIRPLFDIVLVDCPPGLSVLTESWLREADYHLTPTKPDYISSCGLDVFRRFKALNPEMGFAENLGVIINMKDRMSAADDEYHAWLASDADNRCFDTVIPRASPLQDAARFDADERSYQAKYPGDAGRHLRELATEILRRMTPVTSVSSADPSAETSKPGTAPSGQAEENPAIKEPASTPSGDPKEAARPDTRD